MLSLVQFLGFGLLTGIPAIICGAIAMRQIRERNESGRGMALAGVIIGSIGTALTALFIIAIIIAAASGGVHSTAPIVGPGGTTGLGPLWLHIVGG